MKPKSKDIQKKISELNETDETVIASSETLSSDMLAAREKMADIELKKEELEQRKEDREQRKRYSKRLVIFVCAYLLIAIAVVCLCGRNKMTIDSKVLITLLSTTTANVIGLFAVVAKYLFHK